MTTLDSKRRISFGDLGREPFRIFFPAGVFAGIVGVSLWPLYFTGLLEFYPGLGHARIMAYGMFGGFIFGFLGTAMPRMLGDIRRLPVDPRETTERHAASRVCARRPGISQRCRRRSAFHRRTLP